MSEIQTYTPSNGAMLVCSSGGDYIKTKDHLATIARLKAENKRLIKWVNDLQSGMYINCVYCGHCYGPQDKVPCSMAEALKKHIEQCPKHPMSALKQDLAACRKVVEAVRVLAHDDSFNAWQQMYKIRQLLPEARAKE